MVELSAPSRRHPGRPLRQRDLEIFELRRNGAGLGEIGARYGISRERVRQVVNRVARVLGIAAPGERCPRCGAPARVRSLRPCRACRQTERRTLSCRRCGRTFVRPLRLRAPLCPQCRTESRPCAWCGKPVVRERTQQGYFRNRLWFCDRRCFGRWTGSRHGWQRLGTPRLHVGRGVAILSLPGALAALIPAGRVAVEVHNGALLLRPSPEGRSVRAHYSAHARSIYITKEAGELGWTAGPCSAEVAIIISRKE